MYYCRISQLVPPLLELDEQIIQSQAAVDWVLCLSS